MPDAHAPQAPLRRADFPAGFRWGCATSAYQVEGAAREEGRGESIWDRFCAQPGRVADGSSGAVACDHYHRWPADLDLLRSLGANAYRFSIAWPRVLPAGRSKVNVRGLDFYSRLVDGLLERGLEPWPTLYHWDLPQALQDEGGWVSRATVDAFAEFADAVSRRLGDRVRHWITHNEPWCSGVMGHRDGVHAPGLRDARAALQACHHILLSHGRAVPILRANVREARVGISLSLHPLLPATASAADAAAVHRHDGLRNRWFLDPVFGRGYPDDTWRAFGRDAPATEPGDLQAIGAPLDFLGVNYYFPEAIADAPGAGPLAARVVERPGVERTAMGWEVCPGGLATLLGRLQAEYHPASLVVTENGACFDDVPDANGDCHDEQRRAYFESHLLALREAMQRGAPVHGYFAWSLLDNFEWAEGYARRFGLAHVDFTTQRRRLKASGAWYRDFLTAP